MNKTRSSTKIALAFVAIAAGAYFGYGLVSGWMVNRKVFTPLKPGNVNIVGVDTGAGYYVVVANQIAQLVRGQADEFQPGSHEEADTEKKRVPIRELLQSLQGDEEALGKLIMEMNDISDAEFPAYPHVWKAEDIRKACLEDGELRKKLENDLNVRLDGTPLGQVRTGALEEGILVDSPVAVEVQVGAEKKKLTGRIQQQYIPAFCRQVWNSLAEKSNLTPSMIAGYYRTAAQELFDKPERRENVKQSLLSRVDAEHLATYAVAPEKVLESAMVIVSDELIESAEYSSYKTGDGKPLFDLVLNLNDEGRQRLWQYSKRNPNAQLLVTWEGIAIAAPRIKGELALSRVTVSQLPDEGLVRDTVEAINRTKKGTP